MPTFRLRRTEFIRYQPVPVLTGVPTDLKPDLVPSFVLHNIIVHVNLKIFSSLVFGMKLMTRL